MYFFSSWLIWNFGCHLGIFDFTVKYVYTFRYLCTFCGSSEHRDNSKKKVYLGIFLWVKRVKKYEYQELIRALGLFFLILNMNCIFIFWNLLKRIQKIFQIEINKAPQSCEILKRGNSGKKWHCFCPNAKINFFPSFAIWICTSRVVIGNRTGFWTSTDIRFKVWDVRINPII